MKAIGHLSIGYPGSEVDEEFELDDDVSEEEAYKKLDEWKNDYIEVWFTDEDGNDIKWKH